MKRTKIISLSGLFLLALSALPACNKSGSACAHEFGNWFADENNGCHVRYCELCGAKEEQNHHYGSESVILKEPTCKEEGIEAIVCDICHNTIETVLPKTNNHHYDTFVSHDERNHTVECSICEKIKTESHKFSLSLPNIEFMKQAATCEESAVYYTSCECGASSKDTIYEETFTYGPKLDHNIYGLKIVSAPKKLSYAAYEEFDPEGLVLSYSCLTCHKTNMEITVADGITFSYEGSNNSFRVGETMIQANFLGKNVVINGITVKKNTNEIYGLEDIATTCGQMVDLNNISSKLGKVELKVLDKNGKVVKETSSKQYQVYEESAPYTIEAKVSGTSQYDGVETRTATVNVAHSYLTTDDQGASKCLCGRLPVEKYYYVIDEAKVYTEATFGDMKEVAINGTLVDPATGRAPDFTVLEPSDQMIVKATKGDQTVSFYVTGVTTILKTEEEMNEAFWANEHAVSGYFLLGNDIESWTTKPYEGNIGAIQNAVKITFDGLGHHIKKFTTGSNFAGIFGSRSVTGSVFTDLHFDNITTKVQSAGLFGYVGDNIDFRNSTFVTGADNTCLIGGVLAYASNKFTNCEFDFGSYNNVFLFSNPGNSNDKLTFANCVAYYVENKTQTIFKGTASSHSESGLTWIKK